MLSLLQRRLSSTKWHVHLEPREITSREMPLTVRSKKKTSCVAWQSARIARGREPRTALGCKSSVKNGRQSKEKERGGEEEKRIGSEGSSRRETGRGHENETGIGKESIGGERIGMTETTGEEIACRRRRLHLHPVVAIDRLPVHHPLRHGDRLFLHHLTAPSNDPSRLPGAPVRVHVLHPCITLVIGPTLHHPVEDVTTPATLTAMIEMMCEVVTFRVPLDRLATLPALAHRLPVHLCQSAQIVVDREVAVTELRSISLAAKSYIWYICSV